MFVDKHFSPNIYFKAVSLNCTSSFVCRIWKREFKDSTFKIYHIYFSFGFFFFSIWSIYIGCIEALTR